MFHSEGAQHASRHVFEAQDRLLSWARESAFLMSSPVDLLSHLCILHSVSVQVNMSYHLLHGHYVPGILFGAIIVPILLRMEVSHRDESQSLFGIHAYAVVFRLLCCTAFQRQVWKFRDQVQSVQWWICHDLRLCIFFSPIPPLGQHLQSHGAGPAR